MEYTIFKDKVEVEQTNSLKSYFSENSMHKAWELHIENDKGQVLSFNNLIYALLGEVYIQYHDLPWLIRQQLVVNQGSPEHPFYHPEGTLDAHIFMCVLKAVTMEVNSKYERLVLVFSALLHDICKSGECEALWKGVKGNEKTCKKTGGLYHAFYGHPKAAVSFIQLPAVSRWLESYTFHQGNVLKAVEAICGGHMRMKTYLKGQRNEAGGMGEAKREIMENSHYCFELAYRFSSEIDNMRQWL